MNTPATIIHQANVLGHDLPIYGTAENPLFLAKDIAELIEAADTSTMLRVVDEDEKILRSISGQLSAGNPNKWFLTEHGLYEVLMQSRKPVAKQFKKQVKQILSQIRQRGVYATQNLSTETAVILQSPNQTLQLAVQVMDSLTKFAQKQMTTSTPTAPEPPQTETVWSLANGTQTRVIGSKPKAVPCELQNTATGEIKQFPSLRSALIFLHVPPFGFNCDNVRSLKINNWVFSKIER
jgi:prophage antirepressor-like protein